MTFFLSRKFPLRSLAAIALGVLVTAGSVSAFSADKAPAAQKLTRDVNKPLAAVDKLIKAGTVEGTAPLMEQARAAAKTDYDNFTIDEIAAQIALKQKDYSGAADALEAALGLNQYTPDMRNKRLGVICSLRFQMKQTDKALAACDRAVKEAGPDYDVYSRIAQMQFSLKKWPETAAAAQAATKIGGVNDETLYEMAFNSYLNLKDKVGQRESLRRLVLLKPRGDYWSRLVDLDQQNAPKKPRLDLDFDRVRLAAGLIESSDQYTEMAAIASEAGYFSAAQKILQAGLDAKVLDRGKAGGLLAKAKAAVAEDQRGLPKFAKEAQAAKDGSKDLILGQAYVDYDRYDEGIAAIKRAMAKGVNASEGNLRLGQALMAAGKRDEARQSFAAVSKTSPFRDIADLWVLYLDVSAKTAAAATPAAAPAGG